jgi:hypothetical protein
MKLLNEIVDWVRGMGDRMLLWWLNIASMEHLQITTLEFARNGGARKTNLVTQINQELFAGVARYLRF